MSTPSTIHTFSQLRPGTRVENLLTGDRFVVLANNGNRVTAVDSIALVTVNDHAHKEWFCATSDLPLNRLKVGDIITNRHAYVITHISDYILHASRSVEITNPGEFLLLD